MPRALTAALLAAALLAGPAAAADFETLSREAQRLDALEPFLARYVGHCTDPYERRTCEANVAAARRALAGRTYAVRIGDAAQLVKPSLQGAKFLLLVTPFVDGGGLALTHGRPSSQDAAGHPLIGFIPIRGTLPPGTLDMEFQGPFRTGAIELEIVFKPESTWKLRRKGERGDFEGVAARFLAIRVLDARTGAEIASKIL
jgi:hypothetical protein